MDAALLKILARIDTHQLPAIPKVLLSLIEAFQNQQTSFDDLTRIIAQDAGLSSKVLAAANSSFYQQFGELKNLNRVVVVLGLETLKTITMTSATQQFFSQIPASQQNFLEVIWFRSLACAHFARRLAKLTGFVSPDQAYLTGLLHRLGQLVLLQCFPKEYSALLSEHSEDVIEVLEKKAIGISHNEIGAHIIDTWNVQGFIADAVHYQNQEISAILDSSALVKLVNLAAQLSRFDSPREARVFESGYALFGLSQPFLEEISSDVMAQVNKTAGSLGISLVKRDDSTAVIKARVDQRNAIFKRLGEHTKDLAFIGAITRNNDYSDQIDDVIGKMRRDLKVLFGFSATAVFLLNKENMVLEGYSSSKDETLSKLSIDFKENRSLAANALLQKRILDSFNTVLPDPFPVVDRQICRLLAAQGMVVIPLIAKNHCLGVVAAGLEATDLPKLKAKLGLIAMFSGEAAQSFLNHRQIDELILDRLNTIQTDFQLQAKKVIHEANNPLSIINNYLYLLGQKLGENSPQEIGLIQQEINRVGELILTLSDTQGAINEDNDLVDINVLIQDLVSLFKGGLFTSYRVNSVLKLDDKLPKIALSKPKLKQLLTNLIKNAAEALSSGGGDVTITTQDRVYLGSKCCVQIEIKDDGPGFPEKISNNLFSPVISTKGAGHSGLGLTIAKNLADELSGTISCSSVPGAGTSFQIFLPRKT
ncbi:MAG: HDOD domain-containing protein [Methylicorpusculum sp.]|uniref:HDOD domain-containing protein n=1 Tax=Methylicorpusculum sp. TaxID=2713644 RepID=UPI00271958AD|nr:HDOD domain-containing protein [Methylicorpusculum sp.]MDO8940780.1 HDOD domain-containing protein [Methylicorpusculum sp.]MDP2201399.1 HDOD domain-containing protein [Methylicorpusculum sp.]